MKKCYAKIEYKDGKITIEECKLRGDLSFGLREMEEWMKKDIKVKKVKCFVKKEINLKERRQYGKVDGNNSIVPDADLI